MSASRAVGLLRSAPAICPLGLFECHLRRAPPLSDLPPYDKKFVTVARMRYPPFRQHFHNNVHD
jgi:hypothetical protein